VLSLNQKSIKVLSIFFVLNLQIKIWNLTC